MQKKQAQTKQAKDQEDKKNAKIYQSEAESTQKYH